jgi:hypothetical protein
VIDREAAVKILQNSGCPHIHGDVMDAANEILEDFVTSVVAFIANHCDGDDVVSVDEGSILGASAFSPTTFSITMLKLQLT